MILISKLLDPKIDYVFKRIFGYIENYQKVILTDVMEFYIIELPKYEKYKDKIENKKLNNWIKFIKEENK